MLTFTGEPVYGGTASGRFKWHQSPSMSVPEKHISGKTEKERFLDARRQAFEETELLYQSVFIRAGKEAAMVLKAHQMILDDPEFKEMVLSRILNQEERAETAVKRVGDDYYKMFEAMADPYMRERSADVTDIVSRLIRILSGEPKSPEMQGDEPVILCGEELLPSEIAALNPCLVKAVVTSKGSPISHMAILARALEIPTVVGVDGLVREIEGREGVVYGDKGKVLVGGI